MVSIAFFCLLMMMMRSLACASYNHVFLKILMYPGNISVDWIGVVYSMIIKGGENAVRHAFSLILNYRQFFNA